MKNAKLGILGFGHMGQLHLKNCLRMKKLEVAVADKSKSALRKAREMGVKETYRDYKELFKKANLDAVIITLPNFIHKESACLAAEEGLDIFVEKPLARTAKECEKVVQSASKNSVKLMVGFYQRFIDRNRDVKSEIDDGAFGDIELITFELVDSGPFFHRFPPSPVPEWWLDSRKMGGGVLLDTGSHAIDLMRWLLNDNASVKHVYLGYRFRLPFEDTAILLLQFNGGTKAALMAGWFTPRTNQRIAFYGTAKAASLEMFKSEINMKRAANEAIKNVIRKILGREIAPFPLSEISRAYYKEIKNFVDCVREDKEPLVTGKDGLECAKIIDEAYQLGRSMNSVETRSY
ncbi:MAG: Gfo/Idh/MocA family oxidoreductase [Candidatus Bathyarchaeota archaeon]|jgi:predicted dehydrogenase